MRLHLKKTSVLFSLASLGLATSASAAVIGDFSPGTASPPSTLGGYSMAAFPADLSAEGTATSFLTPPPIFPGWGDLQFSTPVTHSLIGTGWGTWSHGYAGSVYFTGDSDLQLELPDGTLAFYLYLEPNMMATYEFTVESSSTSGSMSTTLLIDGAGGAKYVGFYTDDPLSPLQYVDIVQTTATSDGFAVGEFGINTTVPEPGACVAFAALGLLGFAAVRRSRR